MYTYIVIKFWYQLYYVLEKRGGGILYCTVLGIQSNTPIFELLTQQKSPGCNVRLMLIAQPIILVAQMHIILLLLSWV